MHQPDLNLFKNTKYQQISTNGVFSLSFSLLGIKKNFTKFAGKNLCQRLFFSKAAGPRPGTLLKKDSGTGVFL